MGKDDRTGVTVRMPVVTERGRYLQANGEDVEFFGYVSALNRASELNNELYDGFRWIPVEKGYEDQMSLAQSSMF